MSARPEGELADSSARRRAATDFDRNLVMVAGAGTGKTSLLVERILVAIGSGIADIPRIAALTFTEKAAGEIRERLALGLEALRRLGSTGDAVDPEHRQPSTRAWHHLTQVSGVSGEEIAARALAALERLDQAPVVTIHTFCAQLLRAWPMRAGVDPGFVVDEGEEFERLFDEEWLRFLARELGPAAPRRELWQQVLRDSGLESLHAIARALARFGVPAEAIREHATRDGSRLVAGMAEEAVRRIDELLGRATGIKAWKLQFLTGLRSALAAAATSVAALQQLVSAQPELHKRVTAGKPPAPDASLAGASAGEFSRLVRDANDLVRDLLAVDDAPFRAAVEAVSEFCLGLRETFLSRGFVSFDGILVLARDLLRDHDAAREAAKRRFRLILVDEFQDTDPLQYEIVLFLGEREGECAQEAYATRLEPGKLFIVGDPKQSIYRFRGADYTAFDRAARRVVETGGEELTLTSNFRSLPGIVEPINALFHPEGRSVWCESAYQPRYIPITAARAGGEGPAVEVWTVTAADGAPATTAPERRRIEGRILAREIACLKRTGTARSYAEITVLLRSFSSLAHYLRAFREAGIPFVVAGGREFLARPEVSHLLSVLRAIAQPSDEIALLAYLRSPAGGVPDIELAAFADEGGAFGIRSAPDRARFPALSDALARLRVLAEEVRELPAAKVVGRVLRRTGLSILSAVAFEGAQRVSNLRKLAAAAAEIASDGRMSLREVLDAIEEERLGRLEADSPLADEGSEAVRILTVHATKGLENRFVFVADLAREGNRAASAPEVLVAWTPARIPILAFCAAGARSTARVWLDRENGRHDEAEEVRILYVALTRACDRLVVLTAPPRGNRSPGAWLRALAPWSYDAASPPGDAAGLDDGRVRHRLIADPGDDSTSAPERPADVEVAESAYLAALSSLRAATRPPVARPSGTEESRGPEVPELRTARTGPDRSVARVAGTVVHRFLETWDGVEEASTVEGRLVAASELAAADLGCDPAEVRREAAETVRVFLSSPLAARFRAIHPVARELPVILAHAGSVWRGTIDLVYRDGDGTLVIADFKTDRERSEHAQASYRAQLDVYREAVRRSLGLPELPAGELWWLRQARIERW